MTIEDAERWAKEFNDNMEKEFKRLDRRWIFPERLLEKALPNWLPPKLKDAQNRLSLGKAKDNLESANADSRVEGNDV